MTNSFSFGSRTAVAVVLLSCACTEETVLVSSAAPSTTNATRTYDSAMLARLPDLQPSLIWRVGQDSGVAAIEFQHISDIAADGSGTIYVLDVHRGISVFSSDGTLLNTFAPRGPGPAELANARSIAVGGDTVFVMDNTLKLFSVAGRFLAQVSTISGFERSEKIVYTDSGLAVHRYQFGVRRDKQMVHDTLEVHFIDLVHRPEGFATHKYVMASY